MVTSIVIPTRNRTAALEETLEALYAVCDLPGPAEVLVVDDGSEPPLSLQPRPGSRVLRLEGEGRSAARNAGASCAADGTLIFLDDDMSVAPGFLQAHARAQAGWPGAMAVGAIRLPDLALAGAFGRFRQSLEDAEVPAQQGITRQRNLCAAGNMSIPRARFLELGGFDTRLSSGEDQDLALRHTDDGGQIVFVPEARAVHRDRALDIRSYCRRVEAGSEQYVAFVRKQPHWGDNQQRQRINGPLAFGREPLGVSIGKVFKALLGARASEEGLFLLAGLLERSAPGSSFLHTLYRMLLGIHIRRGYMRGLRAPSGG